MAESSFSHSVSINVILHPKMAFICSIPEVTLTGGVGRVIPSVLQHSFTLIYCPDKSRSQSCLQRRSVEGVLVGGTGLGGGAGLALRGLPELPPSLSVFVLEAERGGCGDKRGRDDVAEASGEMREQEDVERRL